LSYASIGSDFTKRRKAFCARCRERRSVAHLQKNSTDVSEFQS